MVGRIRRFKQLSPTFQPWSRLVSSAARVALPTAGATLASMLIAASAQADDPTFRVHAKFQLCPEYPVGGVSLEYGYRVGTEKTYHTVAAQNESLSTAQQTGEADFDLPANFGTTPIAFAAFCRSSRGLSAPSAEKVVTFCDAEKLRDSDQDGVSDADEDSNCNGFFDPADRSNLFNVDTDGDGVRDLVELFAGTDPSNPGSSPRPYVAVAAPFDPDGDGNSNAVAWRPAQGNFYIKDIPAAGQALTVQWGFKGDLPFAYNYRVENTASNNLGLKRGDVGVIRKVGTQLQWLLHGKGFERSDGTYQTNFNFGIFGDNIVNGSYEIPGVTNPAVAHVFAGVWTWYILKRDGTIATQFWGGNFDVPKPSDYDGDGITDIAVYRPATQTTYIIRSRDQLGMILKFGSGTADTTVRGSFTDDQTDDIAFWEPSSALFSVMKSDNGFNETGAANHNPLYYLERTLGTYNVTLPINWQMFGGRQWFSVVDHATGIRQFADPRNPASPVQSIQWGLPGDSQG